jgi:hypothetical protein
VVGERVLVKDVGLSFGERNGAGVVYCIEEDMVEMK